MFTTEMSPQWESCAPRRRVVPILTMRKPAHSNEDPAQSKNKINKNLKKEWAMNLEPFLTKSRRASQPYNPWWAWPYVGISFSLFPDTVGFCFVLLKGVWVIGHVVNPTAVSVPCKMGTRSFYCSTRRVVHANSPCIGYWKEPTGPEGVTCAPLKLCLALSLL